MECTHRCAASHNVHAHTRPNYVQSHKHTSTHTYREDVTLCQRVVWEAHVCCVGGVDSQLFSRVLFYFPLSL
jgi:hypothetical protein